MKNKIYVCKIEKLEDIIKNNKFEKKLSDYKLSEEKYIIAKKSYTALGFIDIFTNKEYLSFESQYIMKNSKIVTYYRELTKEEINEMCNYLEKYLNKKTSNLEEKIVVKIKNKI